MLSRQTTKLEPGDPRRNDRTQRAAIAQTNRRYLKPLSRVFAGASDAV
jgi:hypothetical protein